MTVAPVLDCYGPFAAFLGAGELPEDRYRTLRQPETTGRPLGSEDWLAALEAETGRSLKARKRGPKPGRYKS